MKKVFIFACIAVAVATAYVAAQEPASPPADAAPAAPPAAEASPAPSPAIEPPQLIPAPPLPSPEGVNTGPSGMPDLSQLDQAFKQAPASKEAQEFKLRVEWRQLQNRTTNDPVVVGAREHAEAATTDLEKRERLRAYYRTFYRRMRSLAASPEMKAYLDSQMTGHLALTAQPRVRPTPTPKPGTAGSTAPAASTALPPPVPIRRMDRPKH
jgi:hypothetical protein